MIGAAEPMEIQAWSQRIDAHAAGLRAGPWLVIGQAYDAREQFDQAALAYLHVPLVYPSTRRTAVAALGHAGQSLDREAHRRGRAALREMVDRYAETPYAAEAARRLESLDERQGNSP